MSHDFHTIEKKEPKPFVVGLVISLILTLAAFWIAMQQLVSGIALHLTLAILASIQALVQLVLFLNLGREEKPRWNLAIFLCTLTVVFIIVFGSIWIMNNLNYNLMMDHA